MASIGLARFGDGFDDRQQTEFFEARHLRFDITQCQTELAALLETVRSKSSDAGQKIGKIHFAFFFEAFLCVLGDDQLDDVINPGLGGDGRLDGDELAIDAEDDRPAGLNVNIRSTARDGGLKDALKDFHGPA